MMGFIAEAQDVLRAGLETAPFVSADDTGARAMPERMDFALRSAMTGSRHGSATRPSKSFAELFSICFVLVIRITC